MRSTNGTVIRAAGLGYTPHFDDGRLDNFRAFQSYLDEVNSRIARTASDSDIPLSEVHLDKGYISQDRLHPNDQGYEVIAQRLRELGYSPLK